MSNTVNPANPGLAQITQDQVNKDQENVRLAAKNGVGVQGIVEKLVEDQAALNKQNGTGKDATLAQAKDYMDKFLKQENIDTKSMDDAFAKVSKYGDKRAWGSPGSLDYFAHAAERHEVEETRKNPSRTDADK